MGKERFVKFRLDLLSVLDDYHPAVVIYGYLVLCNSNRYVPKDEEGYFELSSAKLFDELRYRRATQDRARRLLRECGLIVCRIGDGRSPTTKYKVLEKRNARGDTKTI
jgi:hypothetical protein